MKRLFLLIALMIIGVVFSQKIKKNTKEYTKLIPLKDAKVKIDRVDNGIVKSSEAYTANSLQIPDNENVRFIYDDEIRPVKSTDVPENLKSYSSDRTQFSGTWMRVPELLFAKEKNSNELIPYHIYVISKNPFKYSHETKNFTGSVDFVLVDPYDETSSKTLETPVLVRIDQGDVDSALPEKLELDKLNLPVTTIKLTEDNGKDSMQIKIITPSKLSGYPVTIKVEPALQIHTLARNVKAYGFEKIKLDVSTIGSSVTKPIQVSLNTESGKLTPEEVSLNHNELVTVKLRSGNKLGQVKIAANGRGADSMNYISNTIVVNYVFPWIFLLFSALGGILGSLARFRSKIKFTKILLGMLDGFVACILYFILKIPIPKLGELDYVGAVIFGVGILGGFATITGIFPYLRSLIIRPDGE